MTAVKTEKIPLRELVKRMRKMEVGTVIDLQGKSLGDGWFGIRRLPDNLFNNGRNWIADNYGGGFTHGFSDNPDDDYCLLFDDMSAWLYDCDLSEGDDETVVVKVSDGAAPEPEQKNKMVVIEFSISPDIYRTHLSVPQDATDEAILEIGQRSVEGLTETEFFNATVPVSSAEWNPEVTWMQVLHDWDTPTDKPIGTLD